MCTVFQNLKKKKHIYSERTEMQIFKTEFNQFPKSSK